MRQHWAMSVDDVIAYFGTAKKAADALGLKSHAAVILWRRSGIPYPRQCQIQIVTNGALMAVEPEAA